MSYQMPYLALDFNKCKTELDLIRSNETKAARIGTWKEGILQSVRAMEISLNSSKGSYGGIIDYLNSNYLVFKRLGDNGYFDLVKKILSDLRKVIKKYQALGEVQEHEKRNKEIRDAARREKELQGRLIKKIDQSLAKRN